jgi:hypothetical protein
LLKKYLYGFNQKEGRDQKRVGIRNFRRYGRTTFREIYGVISENGIRNRTRPRTS